MMQMKRYVAPTFAEALIHAKHELGTDAMIVESKKLRVGGFLGFFARQMTELTVAVDQPAAGKTPTRPAPAAVAAYRTAGANPAAPVVAAAPGTPSAGSINGLEREVAALRATVSRLVERGMEPAPVPQLQGYGRKVFDGLVLKGVDEAAALNIAQRVQFDSGDSESALRQELNRLLGPAAPTELAPGHRKVVALVGPTGVGKTTTLAKLAAKFALEYGRNVGLITSDTFRIAAIEQLKTYADILGVPLHTVDSPAQAAQAMKETAHCDLVLVDTGGCNYKDHERMAELRDTLAVLRPDETHLVFALTANPRDAFEALEYYLPLGVNRLTFTKLDEAVAPGLLLNMRMRCNQPVGYLTHGQTVPDDLIPADRADFAKILLGA